MTLGAPCGLGGGDDHGGDPLGDRRFHLPFGRLRVALSGGTLAGRNPGNFKPRVTLKQLDKSLAHRSGGPQDSYRDLCSLRHQEILSFPVTPE